MLLIFQLIRHKNSCLNSHKFIDSWKTCVSHIFFLDFVAEITFDRSFLIFKIENNSYCTRFYISFFFLWFISTIINYGCEFREILILWTTKKKKKSLNCNDKDPPTLSKSKIFLIIRMPPYLWLIIYFFIMLTVYTFLKRLTRSIEIYAFLRGLHCHTAV